MRIDFKQANSGNYRAGRTTPINWIVLHYTGNNGDTAANNATYFAREVTKTSAHYFVDETSIWQSVKDCDTAWHCGTNTGYFNAARNNNSIGVEMCSDVVNGKETITEPTVERTVELVRFLMAKYNVPIFRVCRHYDVTHKQCPAPWVRESALWENFKERLQNNMTEEKVKSLIEQALERKVYDTLDDVPAWARPTVEKLLNKDFLVGDEHGNLNLSTDLLRLLVINDRAGLYK